MKLKSTLYIIPTSFKSFYSVNVFAANFFILDCIYDSATKDKDAYHYNAVFWARVKFHLDHADADFRDTA